MNQRGFTFLEIIVTLALIVAVVFSAFTAFNKGLFQAGNTEDEQLAINLTQAQMETLKDTPFASIASSSPTRSAVSGYAKFEQSVVVSSPFPDLKQVAVTTYWPTQNTEESFSLVSYISS